MWLKRPNKFILFIYLMHVCFFLYYILERPIVIDKHENQNPCFPSPCGPNSICRTISSNAVCSCSQNYIGTPPNCRPECVVNSDCSMSLACINDQCKNPCIGTCGPNTNCKVVSHTPMCFCISDFTGDPFSGCNRIVHSKKLK